jgi:hypothetical protein
MSDRTEKLEIRKGVDGEHYYVVKVGKNGEDLWVSEQYNQKSTAFETADREVASNSELEVVDTTEGA